MKSHEIDLGERLLNEIVVGDDGYIERPTSSGVVTPGLEQPSTVRDLPAAVLFVGHVLILAYLAVVHGLPNLNFEAPVYATTETVHFAGIFIVFLLVCLVALALTAVLFGILTRYVTRMVEIALSTTIAMSVLLILIFLKEGYWTGTLVAGVFVAWGLWYARVVWPRIPFAAANLQTALTAVENNGGVCVLAYVGVLALCLYTILWLLAWIGAYTLAADCSNKGVCENGMNAAIILWFVIDFYWTSRVVAGWLSVTVAGVVGTWWFRPDAADHFWSSAIGDSAWRATSLSMGSICLGALLTAVLQVAHQLVRSLRSTLSTSAASLLLCVVDCLLGFLSRLVEYFNQYALVYIGLYGYDFLTAGKKTFELFTNRGWTTIINDDLIGRVLSLMSMVIGLLTGAAGLAIAAWHPNWTDEFGSSHAAVAFFLSFGIGTATSSVVMGVVRAATDTILVAFAEAPADFERNHPGLHRQMITAWRQVYPDECGL